MNNSHILCALNSNVFPVPETQGLLDHNHQFGTKNTKKNVKNCNKLVIYLYFHILFLSQKQHCKSITSLGCTYGKQWHSPDVTAQAENC
jgi:hypothetical protein